MTDDPYETAINETYAELIADAEALVRYEMLTEIWHPVFGELPGADVIDDDYYIGEIRQMLTVYRNIRDQDFVFAPTTPKQASAMLKEANRFFSRHLQEVSNPPTEERVEDDGSTGQRTGQEQL